MNGGGDDGGVAKPGMKKNLSVRANIMTPVKPMLVCTVCTVGWSQGGRESWGDKYYDPWGRGKRRDMTPIKPLVV